MTDAARKEDQETLFVTDDELFKRLGVTPTVGRPVLHRLDAERNTFPPRDALWGGRRYWPAVKAFFDQMYGVRLVSSAGEKRR